MRITKDVFQIVLLHPYLQGNVNAYLITGGDLCLIDTGFGDPASISAIANAFSWANVKLQDLRLIVNTHAHIDHICGAPKLRLFSNAKIAMHKLEYARIKELQFERNLKQMKVDVFLEDGDIIDLKTLELKVIHTPGHTNGHICLYHEESGILFSGDHIISGTPTGTVYVGPPDGDVAQYLISLKKILRLDLKMILPGHGQIIYDPHEKINNIIRHHLEREKQIISILESGEKTAEQIAITIYNRADSITVGAVVGRLKKLIADGAVEIVQKEHVDFYKIKK